MGEEVVLLDFQPSMFGMRVRIALAEKGVEYVYKEENLRNKSPLLLKNNPIHKKIPVLIHNGKSICESLNIVEYIDEFWKDKAPLLPFDPYDRAQARFWADFIDKKVHEDGRGIWASKVDQHEKAQKELKGSLKQLEEVLGDKPYFGGDSFGFLDVALIPFHQWFYAYEKVGSFKLDCPKLIGWAKRCLQRESVSTSLASEKDIYEFVLGYRKTHELD
ncbi:probable glutathione S-transferase parC [Cajanus cajan]|uniref:Glutathione S-transferase n=1 Tax=Cajanus cajan TaxID=3821 RepID=A0A151R5A0_CAJCA|nr:probable glutathione S-transferase parC [Cajanus cajan]KYP37760.1 putative glutathione S-transferase parC [Cajanus cajan]